MKEARQDLLEIVRKFGSAQPALETICFRCGKPFGAHRGAKCPKIEEYRYNDGIDAVS